MKYKTIIWDWNGTLLNDLSLCLKIVNDLLKEYKLEALSKEKYLEIFGFPVIEYYERLGFEFSAESFDEFATKFIGPYLNKVKECSLHEKSEEVLDDFKSRGMNQFILTAAHKKDVAELAGHFGVDGYFQGIEGLDNHKAESKVQRGIALIEDHGILRGETILIGDTMHDYEVAREIGVDCMLISNGHQSPQRLKNHLKGRCEILGDITELLNR